MPEQKKKKTAKSSENPSESISVVNGEAGVVPDHTITVINACEMKLDERSESL